MSDFAYRQLDERGRELVLADRVKSLEAEHFSHGLNLKMAVALDDQELAVRSKQAMVKIEAALEVLADV